MPTVVQIDNDVDRARAVDILVDAGETVNCVPVNRFIISNRGPALLRENNIRFRLLGGEEREAPDAESP